MLGRVPPSALGGKRVKVDRAVIEPKHKSTTNTESRLCRNIT